MAFESLKNQMFSQASVVSTSAERKEALGTLRVLDDGRKFRYCKNGAVALVGGNAVQAPAVVANHINRTPTAVATGKSSVSVPVGATAVTANQYAGGYLQVNAGANSIGYQYKIAANSACLANGTTVLTLDEPLATAFDANSRVSLIANLFAAVVVTTAANVNVIGVAPCNVAAEAFFWAQTGGLACAEINGTPAVGSNLFAAADGELDGGPNTTTGQALAVGPMVGYLLATGVNNECKPVMLTID